MPESVHELIGRDPSWQGPLIIPEQIGDFLAALAVSNIVVFVILVLLDIWYMTKTQREGIKKDTYWLLGFFVLIPSVAYLFAFGVPR